jgi:hypothetical protein
MSEKKQCGTVRAVEHCLSTIFFVNHFSGL